MGPTETDVALALAGTVPIGGKLFTGLTAHQEIFEQAARDRKSETISISKKEVASITSNLLDQFSYIEHAENVALALKVCEDLGVDRQKALSAMQKANPDPGAMVVYELNFFGRQFYFVNGFAANDPEST